MNEFKVGDKVECLVYGKGEVVELRKAFPEYPVGVKFESGRTDNYTKDGRLHAGYNITLTKGTWKVEEVPTEVTYKKGELVWASLGTTWCLCRYKGKAQRDTEHFVGSLATGSDHMQVSFCNEIDSKYIRKFKDNPYDIND